MSLRLENVLEWLEGAKPGERITYHQGYLAEDRMIKEHLEWGVRDRSVEPIHGIAVAMERAYARGDVTLVQKRNGAFDYDYIAVKRP